MTTNCEEYLNYQLENYIPLNDYQELLYLLWEFQVQRKSTLINRFVSQVLGKILYRVHLTSKKDEIQFNKNNFIECNPDKIGDFIEMFLNAIE